MVLLFGANQLGKRVAKKMKTEEPPELGAVSTAEVSEEQPND